MKIRMKFRKYGAMKFIGHLDIMRYFQKCMRRGGIDIAYSGGFSPHQIMSFAAPLGVGITNEVMVEGIEVTSYRKLKDTDKKAMSLVAAADYKVYLKNGYEVPQVNYEEAYRKFYVEPSEILITKQTKKSEKVMDLKKLLYDFKIYHEEGKPVFYLKVCTGSTDNVKPELVLEAFYQSVALVLDPLSIQIHRLDVYGWEGERLVSLGEMGEVIE